MSVCRTLIRIILLLAVVIPASANDLSRSDKLRLIGRFLPEGEATLAFTWPGSGPGIPLSRQRDAHQYQRA